MKYLLVLIFVIGMVTYIFVGGPRLTTEMADASVDRRRDVWDRIAQLEYQRRDMLIRAKGRMGGGVATPAAGSSPRYIYSSGYRQGFNQGYFEGSFLAERTEPNPLFFPIPRP